ncbi:MAG: hypothetical protein HY238_18930 [Acidobacteria bacterium]|nr:hypothetical protein [Acidobacteriota bacterium]
MERQEKLTGKTLDENEVRQPRYNAVVRADAKGEYQNRAGAAARSAAAQSRRLHATLTNWARRVGKSFNYLRTWVGHLRDLVGFLKDNPDWLVKFAQGAMLAAGILATYALGSANALPTPAWG